MGELSETTTIRAPRDEVWALISVQENWADWVPSRKATLERTGSPEPDGVGAVRLIGIVGPIGIREEITAYDAPGRMAYRMASRFPVRDYRADMRLTADGDETVLEWSAEWVDRWGFTSGAAKRSLGRSIARMASGIKAEAERRSSLDD